MIRLHFESVIESTTSANMNLHICNNDTLRSITAARYIRTLRFTAIYSVPKRFVVLQSLNGV